VKIIYFEHETTDWMLFESQTLPDWRASNSPWTDTRACAAQSGARPRQLGFCRSSSEIAWSSVGGR